MLRARLQLLRSSLLTVQRALQDIESHRHAGPAQAELMQVTTQVLAGLKGLGGRRDQVSEACQGDTVKQELLMTWLRELEPLAAQAEKVLSQPPKRPFLILDDTSVDENLREDVTNQLEELDRLEEQVISAARGQDGGGETLAQVWSAYRDAEVESRTLFAEYLDLVRGVLLRDAGFDNELCHISDALIRSWGRFRTTMAALTILASHERDEASVARLIRIGFPEWTIWVCRSPAANSGTSSPHAMTRCGISSKIFPNRPITSLGRSVPGSPTRSQPASWDLRMRGPSFCCAPIRSWPAIAIASK